LGAFKPHRRGACPAKYRPKFPAFGAFLSKNGFSCAGFAQTGFTCTGKACTNKLNTKKANTNPILSAKHKIRIFML
jgi:hypothetical protein